MDGPERPPSLDPHDPRRRGPTGRARRRVGYGLLVLATALTVWGLRAPGTPPPHDPPPLGCAPGAPAAAVPLALPRSEPDAFAAHLGAQVCFVHDLVVTEVYELGRFGELLLADRRLFGPNTGLELAGDELHLLRLSPGPWREYAWPLPWGLEPGGVRVGDAVRRPYGTLALAPRGGYALESPHAPAFETRNPRPSGPPPRAGDLRVAAFNVGAFFLTLGERGARDAAELERQTRKLVAALLLLDADVIALIEVERGGEALLALADALHQALVASGSERRYRVAPEPAGALGDLIGQGFLYDPERVALVSVAYDAAGVHLRPPRALTVMPHGAERALSVIAVHHRSRAGCPASGDVDRGSGCWDRLRTRQSEAVLAFARQHAGTSIGADGEGADVLVLGDFNAHRLEAPITLFEAERDGAPAWEVLTDRTPPEEAYSYVFFGRSAALDHAVASAGLAERVARFAYLAINADEPPLLAYRVPPGIAAAYAPDAFRSSDHDPLLVDLWTRPPAGAGR